jgi:16S rRNA (cytidine1402-2'-O)-methyltransferase
MAGGTLYVVATPLGHLGDLSPRAAEVLRHVALVAAEDTRRTRQLLTHIGAAPAVVSYHAHSTSGREQAVIDALTGGQDVALVTDAGTPAVSDPGAELVRAAWAAGARVVPIPGPSAVTVALSASGLPADRYLFLGFLPRKGGDRRRLLKEAAASPWTVVLFEAPGRLAALLADLLAVAGPERRVVVARELTKVHEEFRAGTLAEQLTYWSESTPRGEVTVVLGRAERADATPRSEPEAPGRAAVRRLMAQGRTRRDIVRLLMEDHGVSRNEAYRLVTEAQ